MPSLELLVLAVTLVVVVIRGITRALSWLARAARNAAADSTSKPPQTFRPPVAAWPPAELRGAPPIAAATPAADTRPPGGPEAPAARADRPVTPPRSRGRAAENPSARPAAQDAPAGVTQAPMTIKAGRDELLRALIWREVLAPPLCRRQASAVVPSATVDGQTPNSTG